MVGVVLGVEVGLKLPQGASLQVTDQATVPVRLSLVMVAAIPVLLPAVMEVGGVNPGVNATVIGGSAEL